MANIGIFTIPAQGWLNLETIIQEKVPSFAFSTDKTYLMQKTGLFIFKNCIKATTPEQNEGFTVLDDKPFSYTHSGDILWVKASLGPVYLNVAE